MHQVSRTHEAEAAERQDVLLKLQQYVAQLQKGIGFYLQLAQEANIRSDARLGDLANSLAADSGVAFEANLAPENETAQYNGSLRQDCDLRETSRDSSAVDEQPETLQDNSPSQEAQSPNHSKCGSHNALEVSSN